MQDCGVITMQLIFMFNARTKHVEQVHFHGGSIHISVIGFTKPLICDLSNLKVFK